MTKPFVNIAMVTFNRCSFTEKAIRAIVENTKYPYVLTVVDNNSGDGTRDYLEEQKTRDVVTNLVLLGRNVGVAKASNLAWSLEPEAAHYLKLDNDIVIRKTSWLGDMVNVADTIPEIGAVAYNVEPRSFPVRIMQGIPVRIKRVGNLGGACILIPKRTEEILGYWSEEYGLYGEEDRDYGARITQAGLLNAYMEDEEAAFHLPAGKAAAIEPVGLSASDSVEEVIHKEYRKWKDAQRRQNFGALPFLPGRLRRNIRAYRSGKKPIHVVSPFVEELIRRGADLRGPRGKLLRLDDLP